MRVNPFNKNVPVQFLWFVMLMVAGLSPAYGKDVKLLGRAVFAAGSNDVVSGSLLLLNAGNETNSPILSAYQLNSAASGEPLPVQIYFEGTNQSFYKIEDFKPGETRQIDVTIKGFTEAGGATAALKLDDDSFANLEVERLQVPFAVTLANTPAENPEVLFSDDNPGALLLQNADPMSYRVSWSLEINNRVFTNGQGEVVIPPNSTFKLGVPPPPQTDSCCHLCRYLKDTTLPARLILRWNPGTSDYATNLFERSFAVQLRFQDNSECHQILGYVIILFLLALGGMCSLVANNGIPNQIRRMDLRDQLLTLGRRVHNLTAQLDSGVRVQMRMEARRLRLMLEKHILISPELASVFTEVGNGAATLERQMVLLEKMDALYDRLDAEKSVFPPTQVLGYKQRLKQASNLLRATTPPEADLQKAEALIAEAAAALDNLGRPDLDLAKSLVSRITRLKDQFNDAMRKKMSDAGINVDLLKVVATVPKPEEIRPETYASMDTGLYRLEMIADYFGLPDQILLAVENSAQDKTRKEWLQYINLDGSAAFENARRLIEQLKQGIFLEELVGLFKPGAEQPAEIELGQPVVYVDDSQQLSVVFHDSKYNSPITRELLTCVWDFGDTLKEKGWTVYHYFPKARPYDVKVRFITSDGRELNGPSLSLPVRKAGSKASRFWAAIKLNDRTLIELLRFGIALGAVLLALVGGAQQQIAKLDCLPALFAVFLMGFGADTVKNLLSQRTQ